MRFWGNMLIFCIKCIFDTSRYSKLSGKLSRVWLNFEFKLYKLLKLYAVISWSLIIKDFKLDGKLSTGWLKLTCISKYSSPIGKQSIDWLKYSWIHNVFTFGVPPVCIELLTKVKGVEFQSCFEEASFQKFDNIDVKIIDLRKLSKCFAIAIIPPKYFSLYKSFITKCGSLPDFPTDSLKTYSSIIVSPIVITLVL